jgi:hypothetical protein
VSRITEISISHNRVSFWLLSVGGSWGSTPFKRRSASSAPLQRTSHRAASSLSPLADREFGGMMFCEYSGDPKNKLLDAIHQGMRQ